ncbi:MAG: Hpt domain-containing protein, partial [Myxococcota bacterium]
MSPEELRAAFLEIRSMLESASDLESLGQILDELEMLAGSGLPTLQSRLVDEAVGRIQAATSAPDDEREPLIDAARRLLRAGTPKAPEGAEAAAPVEPAEPPPAEPLAVEPASITPMGAGSAADMLPFDDEPEAPAAPASAPPSGGHDIGPASCRVEEDPELVLECIEESFDNLGSAEGALLDLEQNPDDAQLIDTTFRAFHTVKGIAGFLKLTLVTELAHAAENVLSKLRDKEMRYEGPIPSLALDAVDLLRRMTQELQDAMSAGSDPVVNRPETWGDLVVRLRDVAENGIGAVAAPAPTPEPVAA